ncbi:hypothetical protein RQM47_16760 [Rubrivirga sp. S365]|uniref:hypothetical protein n=1 Tax=Rubrivirga sp. S365 TaxID=3076080 RepID=UPI0028C87F0E|nr:hypothetical protein [Rubrivirga sp. S365]MDT7858303.1 hypothetical protein [Rubrivirga sp. S365]
MTRSTSLLSVLLLLSACSATSPEGDPVNALTEQFSRATTQVPAFGGVTFDGDRPVVFTLGSKSEAEPAARSIFGTNVVVRERPAFGGGSEALKGQVTQLLLGAVRDAQTTDYDETTGYVRLGVLTADAVRDAYRVMDDIDFPTENVIVQVQAPIMLY